jgi:hypothetical protein
MHAAPADKIAKLTTSYGGVLYSRDGLVRPLCGYNSWKHAPKMTATPADVTCERCAEQLRQIALAAKEN